MILRKRKEDKIIALAGNPNVGKSTVFNALTGLHQHTGNWSGKTVGTAWGYGRETNSPYLFVDLPGTYSLYAHSEEEVVARNYICSGEADLILIICDAVSLQKNLNLTLQILNVTKKAILIINLMDEAEKKNIYIDLNKISECLSIPVIGICARQKDCCRQILSELDKYFGTHPKHKLKQQDSTITQFCICHSDALDSEQSAALCIQKAEEIFIKTVKQDCDDNSKNTSFSCKSKIDKFLTGKLTGYPIMLLFLVFIFWLTITGANYPSALLSRIFTGLGEKLSSLFIIFHAPDWLHGMLIDGVYRVLSWVVSVMLPPMAIFFPLFTLLEDSGFLPRIAYNLDRPFQKCRACGKQALCMCMGFGCNAAGVTGCRIIDSPRERLIAILTNSFVPCNGRFPTLIALLTMFFITSENNILNTFSCSLFLTLFILLGILMTFFISWLLSRTLLKGLPSAFILELPPYRLPQIKKVLIRSVFDRTVFVLKRAVIVAAPAGLFLWIMANIEIQNNTLLSCFTGLLDPFGKLLGMDGTILSAFILGFPANEIVMPIILMSYLSQGTLVEINDLNSLKEILISNGWNLATALHVMIFSLFHWPCSTTLITIHKETGSLKWTALAFLLPTLIGIVICFILTLLF